MEQRFLRFLIVASVVFFAYVLLMSRLFPPPKQPPPVAGGPQQAIRGGAPGEKAPAKRPSAAAAAKQAPAGKTGEKLPPQPAEKPPAIAARPHREAPEQWVTLGSAEPDPAKNPYRMLVTLTTKGAALARLELSSRRYRDVDERWGYLGHLCSASHAAVDGCPVEVVGPGTPAAEAGLKPGDVIKAVNLKPSDAVNKAANERSVFSPKSLDAVLEGTRPNQTVQLRVLRGGTEITLTATLRRRPLDVIQPEDDDPLSLLLTLSQVDDLKLKAQWLRDAAIYRLHNDLKATDSQLAALNFDDVRAAKEELKIRLDRNGPEADRWTVLGDEAQKAVEAWQNERGGKAGPLFGPLAAAASADRLSPDAVAAIVARTRTEIEGRDQPGTFIELEGVNLRGGTWTLVEHTADRAVFRRALPQWGLEITKTYRLVKVPREAASDPDFPAYHLVFDVGIRNTGGQARRVAYRLDGPNGLPKEGAWYASKVSRNWFEPTGLRDFIISFGAAEPHMIGGPLVAEGKVPPPWPDESLNFIGVDAQYFSAVLIPQRKNPEDVWFDQLMPLRVGKVITEHRNFVNTSCRLVSAAYTIEPKGVLTHPFKLFAGPKRKGLLENEQYRLGGLLYYGWPIFAFFAVPLTTILHGFYAVTFNYGLAIILLTFLVRGCMFPISRKQAMSSIKMQTIQPELKKINEKYKNNVEARTKAMQELYKKHNFNPLSGCLVVFIQMPIFIGLYRALMVDVELRGAPLLSEAVRWCSNLSAPDMLFCWKPWMPDWFNAGVGMFALGPYFNLLPLLTVVLMIWQQKVLTPPPTDEQAIMMQKMMKYMMVFMGLMFFKVASGLCIYIVISSLWSMVERRFLPKAATAPVAAVARARARK